MDFISEKSRIFVSCADRCQPYLAEELEELGFETKEKGKAGVYIEGSMADCIWLNLNLRTAQRVYYSLASFTAQKPEDFYKEAKKVEWENYLDLKTPLKVVSNTYNREVNNTYYTNLVCKDAIMDRMKEITGDRIETGKDVKGLLVYVFWFDDKADVYIDTSGERIDKHGYRKINYEAPLSEALAAAHLKASKWKPNQHLVNPMCGSGTYAIEAALIATQRANGLLRDDYGFMEVKGYDGKLYRDYKSRIKSEIQENQQIRIIASDIKREAIETAKRNAATAGVQHLIEFYICDIMDTPVPDGDGIIIMNAPYGLRVGEVKGLEELYARIGSFLKQKCAGKFGYLFTGNIDLAKLVGLKPKRKIEFYNAQIDCRLLEYEMYSGTKRVFVKTDNSE